MQKLIMIIISKTYSKISKIFLFYLTYIYMENMTRRFQGTVLSLAAIIFSSLFIFLGNTIFADVSAKTINWTISLPWGQVADSGGITVGVSAHIPEASNTVSQNFIIPEWSNSVSYSVAVPANGADSGYEVSYSLENKKDPIRYSNAWYYSSEGTVGGSKLATLVDVSANDATGINLSLLAGNIISGEISLPGADVAQSGGLNIRIEIDSINKWYMGSTYLLVAGWAHSGSYSIMVPANSSGSGYEVSYHLEGAVGNNKYLRSAYYNIAGSMPSWDSASFVDISSNSASGIDMAILTGNVISGTVSLPMGMTAPAWGIEVDIRTLTSNWKSTLAKAYLIIPAGSNSGSYSMVAPLSTGSGYVIAYSLKAFNAWFVDNAYYSSTGCTPYITSSTLVNISTGDASWINMTLLTGNTISGTVSLTGGLIAPAGGVEGTVYIVLPNGEDGTWTDFNIPKGKSSVNYSLTVPTNVSGSGYKLYFWFYANSIYSIAWYYSTLGTTLDPNLASIVDVSSGNATWISLGLIDSISPVVILISSWGGGRGDRWAMDNCIDWDKSGNIHDGKCAWTGTLLVSAASSTWAVQTATWTSNEITFPDINDSFAKKDIIYLAKNKIISWFPDWTFRPDSWATRAEFLAMAIRSLWIATSDTASVKFTDIPASWTWMISYLAKAKELGIANGQTIDWELKFRPNDLITRGEAMSILLNAAKIKTTVTVAAAFTDIPADWTWMIRYLAKAKELGIANGQTIGWELKFRPNEPITRAETTRIITKTLVYLKKQQAINNR